MSFVAVQSAHLKLQDKFDTVKKSKKLLRTALGCQLSRLELVRKAQSLTTQFCFLAPEGACSRSPVWMWVLRRVWRSAYGTYRYEKFGRRRSASGAGAVRSPSSKQQSVAGGTSNVYLVFQEGDKGGYPEIKYTRQPTLLTLMLIGLVS